MPASNPMWIALFPDLRDLPPDERQARLVRAAATEFDWVERLCIGAGTALVAWLVGGRLAGIGWEQIPMLIWQFGAALPPLVLLLCWVHWRRLRRGLALRHLRGDEHE